MDQSSPAGHVGPASFASVKSGVSKTVQIESRKGRGQPLRSTEIHSINYQVADLFGRCFLKVCYLAEIILSFSRGGEPAPYTALPKAAQRSPLHPATTSVSDLINEQAGAALAGPSDAGEA